MRTELTVCVCVSAVCVRGWMCVDDKEQTESNEEGGRGCKSDAKKRQREYARIRETEDSARVV